MQLSRAWTPLLALATGACVAPDPEFASYVETIPGTDVTFEMVWVPEGRFWIGKHEVTWDEYLHFCDFEEKRRLPPGVDAITHPSKPQEDVHPFDRDWGTGRRPAVGMSWNAAKKYCEWLSLWTGKRYRLPAESEWKLACGPAPDELDACAWHFGNSEQMTQEVGKKRANARGLHDMLGNLWEYCRDPYDAADPEWAVLRGGGWSSQPKDVTPDRRLQFEVDWILDDPNVPPGVWWVPHGDHLGFRILRTADR